MVLLKRQIIILIIILKIEGKIPDISNLTTKTALTTVENKIPKVRGLATKTALTAIGNKIPDISNFATKTALTAIGNKIPDISNFATKTALTNLSNTGPDITTLIKKSDYDEKIAEIEHKYVSNTGFGSKCDSKSHHGNLKGYLTKPLYLMLLLIIVLLQD